MTLIFSIYDDPSTNKVVDWLKYKGETIIRINSSDDLRQYFEKWGDIYLSNNRFDISAALIKSVWFRRPPTCLVRPIFNSVETTRMANRYFASEHSAVFDALYTALKDKKWLNDDQSSCPRKLDQLILAKQAGLSIPNSTIIGSKRKLIHFCENNGQIILKPVQDPYPITINQNMYLPYTALVTPKLIELLPEYFYPCLFQQFIDKNLEIRTFYLDGKCYSMAICSTFDKQTQIDFRRYNIKKPNRTIPFQLPADIESKICTLMHSLKLNCGSLDLILDNTGTYYFLEVNPVGQFGMVSFPCNYNLEKKIAEFLSN